MPIQPMKTSDPGRAKLEVREGLELHAYQDSEGVWTIGFGHTSAAGGVHVAPGMRITREQADRILSVDLLKWEAVVNGALKRQATQNQFDALVSLCHNIGAGGFRGSSVVRQFNAGNIHAAADDFLMWERPASLKSRREGERKQFLS